MEEGFGGFSTQWNHVSENLPHNGSKFQPLFHTMETGFARFFHGVGNGGGGAVWASPYWDEI
jgi:hypothetical protein